MPASKTPRAAAPGSAGAGRSALHKVLAGMGLARDIDLALHLPLRYEDETRLGSLADARDGSVLQFEARVIRSEVSYRPRRQLVVTVEDGSDTCVLRFFHFYPSHQKALQTGARVRLRGEVRGGLLGWSMVHPVVQAVGSPLPTALTPIYPSVASMPQAYLRKAVQGALSRVTLAETVHPVPVAGAQAALDWPLQQALQFLHHPRPDVALATLEDRSHPAWLRLKVEELLAQQLSQQLSRQAREGLRAPALHALKDGVRDRLLATLPFALTAAQRRVSSEIAADLGRDQPMHRLLQGDVGSGKTVVAALAAALCIDSGAQCALMVPTEILAEQHFRKLVGWLAQLGVVTAWLSGSQGARERRSMLASIASGEAALVVGTHAMIQERVQFANLALVVIDEQHRFGVAQRLALRDKMADPALEPHLLMMTATPIPRTLAMSYYADLEVSTIDELPPGRTPVLTRLVNAARRDEVVERIKAQVAQGRQVYWVCPLIEESAESTCPKAQEPTSPVKGRSAGRSKVAGARQGREAQELANATATHESLQAALPGVTVGLLHARLPVAEKKSVMAEFVAGRIAVLVSTTVIEVGVDVPDASLMVIEHAERFGLSQLHQLRGRVGRGSAASACVLLYATGDAPRLGETARERLKAMVETHDGFEIARRDLAIRGPGEFLGARQSGAALLRFADLETDGELLAWARAAAPALLAADPARAHAHVARWLGGRTEYLKA